MNIIKKYLDDSCYFKDEFEKTQIVLHHTVSNSWESSWNWWESQKNKISTAYIVDKDGTIIECFDPKFWSYNTGNGRNIDKHNIGIEIVNEGYLNKISDSEFRWFDGKARYNGIVYKLDEEWRGHKYYAKYTDEQVEATILLVINLIKKFKSIKWDIAKWGLYNKNFKKFNGIVSHANVNINKSDISLAFPIHKLQSSLSLQFDLPKLELYKNLDYEKTIMDKTYVV